jgi:hypothetical protein
MSSGNHLVDRYEESQNRIRTCGYCNGDGHVPWSDITDGFEKMADYISFLIYKRSKRGFPCKSFREMLSIAREVKKHGAECPMCDGCGEVEV